MNVVTEILIFKLIFLEIAECKRKLVFFFERKKQLPYDRNLGRIIYVFCDWLKILNLQQGELASKIFCQCIYYFLKQNAHYKETIPVYFAERVVADFHEVAVYRSL